MENATFIKVYLVTFIICTILTIALIIIINKGLKKFFENLAEDKIIAKFFIKLSYLIILLGGISASLTSNYNTLDTATWLTLTWDVTDHLKALFERLFLITIILSVVFFILHLQDKRTNK